MGLLSFFKRNPDTAAEAPAAAQPDAVAAARTRARRRLIGATVLLGIGVIGFPLLFETQPRPIPVNIPIEIPRKDGAPPLLPPAATAPLSPASAAVVAGEPAAPAEPVAKAAPAEIAERAGEQGRELPAPVALAKTSPAPAAAPPKPVASAAPVAKASAARPPTPASKAADKPADKSTDRHADKPSDKPATKPVDDGTRARALLDGQPASAAAAARLVVQVGAYSDAAKLAEARQKLEKLGLKTYTQVVTADGAKRTRVRVGPFANKAEADKAAARIKAAGLPVAILTL